MSPFLETIALYSPVILVFVIALVLLGTTWRRGLEGESDLLLGDMLRRQGIILFPAPGRDSALAFAQAVRRCASCGATKACRAFLESGRREGYEEFCANAAFIARLK